MLHEKYVKHLYFMKKFAPVGYGHSEDARSLSGEFQWPRFWSQHSHKVFVRLSSGCFLYLWCSFTIHKIKGIKWFVKHLSCLWFSECYYKCNVKPENRNHTFTHNFANGGKKHGFLICPRPDISHLPLLFHHLLHFLPTSWCQMSLWT